MHVCFLFIWRRLPPLFGASLSQDSALVVWWLQWVLCIIIVKSYTFVAVCQLSFFFFGLSVVSQGLVWSTCRGSCMPVRPLHRQWHDQCTTSVQYRFSRRCCAIRLLQNRIAEFGEIRKLTDPNTVVWDVRSRFVISAVVDCSICHLDVLCNSAAIGPRKTHGAASCLRSRAGSHSRSILGRRRSSPIVSLTVLGGCGRGLGKGVWAPP